MKRFLFPIRTLIFSVIAAAAVLPAVAQVSGSIQTTLPTGATLQGNIYPSKTQVFFTAGPQNQKASGLPDGAHIISRLRIRAGLLCCPMTLPPAARSSSAEAASPAPGIP